MIKETTIRKFVDYLLLNASSTDSLGLYNGKAGMSLALFETAQCLKDKYVEEQAFILIKEALVIKTNDVSFENGLSGIGYVLLYLIKNNFIEADFCEIFKNKYERILQSIELFDNKNADLPNYISMVYFFKEMSIFYEKEKDYILPIVKKLFEACELYLSIHFFDFNNVFYAYDKNTVIQRFENYLLAVNYFDKYSFSRTLINNYIYLYHKGQIKGSLIIWLQLSIIAKKYSMTELEYTSKQNIGFVIKNINLNTISLRDAIFLLHNFKAHKMINDLNSLFYRNNLNQLEKTIKMFVPINKSYIGYEAGISRYLLHIVNSNIELL